MTTFFVSSTHVASGLSLVFLSESIVSKTATGPQTDCAGFPVAVTEAWKSGNVTRQDFYDIPITSLSPEPSGLWVMAYLLFDIKTTENTG